MPPIVFGLQVLQQQIALVLAQATVPLADFRHGHVYLVTGFPAEN